MAEFQITDEQKNLGAELVLKYELDSTHVKLILGLAAMMGGAVIDTRHLTIAVPIQSRKEKVVMYLQVSNFAENPIIPHMAGQPYVLHKVNFHVIKVLNEQEEELAIRESSWSSLQLSTFVPKWAVDMFYNDEIDSLPNSASNYAQVRSDENYVGTQPADKWKKIRESIRRKETKKNKTNDFLTSLYGDKVENFRPVFDMLRRTGEEQAKKAMIMFAQAMKNNA